MKNSRLQKATALICSCLLFVGCDIVKDDIVPNELSINVELATFAEKPAVINLSSVSGGKELDIKNLGLPKYGDFEILTMPDEDKKFLVYLPRAEFFGQHEELQIELEDKAENRIARLNLNVRSLDNGGDCRDASGIYDYAKILPGESLVLDLLDNDIFCNVGYNGGFVTVYGIQNSNGSNISLGPGKIATLNYTAPEGFTGKVIVIYDLGINWKANANNVDIEDVRKNPRKYFEAFTTAMVEIDVVND
ncbi:MAG: hypothetical protein RIA63_15500 [Cyclobacteriaceae bacterium]